MLSLAQVKVASPRGRFWHRVLLLIQGAVFSGLGFGIVAPPPYPNTKCRRLGWIGICFGMLSGTVAMNQGIVGSHFSSIAFVRRARALTAPWTIAKHLLQPWVGNWAQGNAMSTRRTHRLVMRSSQGELW